MGAEGSAKFKKKRQQRSAQDQQLTNVHTELDPHVEETDRNRGKKKMRQERERREPSHTHTHAESALDNNLTRCVCREGVVFRIAFAEIEKRNAAKSGKPQTATKAITADK